MRAFKLISVLAMVFAFTAIAAASASAEVEFLPGAAGTAFTGKSGKATLQIKGGAAIKCTKSETNSGELLNSKEALFIVHFIGCESLGLAVNSLGDASGIILVHVEARACIINESPLTAGILLKPLPVHLEFPEVPGLLIIIEGDLIGSLTPGNESTKNYSLKLTQKAGVNELTTCKDAPKEASKTEILLSSINGEAFVQSGEEAKEGALTFTTVAQEQMT